MDSINIRTARSLANVLMIFLKVSAAVSLRYWGLYRYCILLTLHFQVYLLRLALTHRVVGLTDVDPGLVPLDVVDGEPLLSADYLPTTLSIPHDRRGGVGSRHTGDGHLVTLRDIGNIFRQRQRDHR